MTEIGVKALLVAVIIFLGIIVFFLGVRVMALNAEMAEVDTLVVTSGDVLYATVGMDCKNSMKKVGITLECLYEALDYASVQEVDFDNFYSADYDGTGGEGYIVIRNDAARVYTSENFRLYQNKVLVDSACHIPGEIRVGYTCRLEFPSKCLSGDILEVMYASEDNSTENQVYLHVCDY